MSYGLLFPCFACDITPHACCEWRTLALANLTFFLLFALLLLFSAYSNNVKLTCKTALFPSKFSLTIYRRPLQSMLKSLGNYNAILVVVLVADFKSAIKYQIFVPAWNRTLSWTALLWGLVKLNELLSFQFHLFQMLVPYVNINYKSYDKLVLTQRASVWSSYHLSQQRYGKIAIICILVYKTQNQNIACEVLAICLSLIILKQFMTKLIT